MAQVVNSYGRNQNDAKVLLDNGNYDGAYYLSGYVIECALKACIAKQTREFDFPDKDRTLSSYTHNIENLTKLAGLSFVRDEEVKVNKAFKVNWALVKDWKETSRYLRYSQKEATDLYTAVADENEGVFQWIKQYW
jgi:HEPN domain-containing protein